jgi:hypothetical protein
MGKKTTFIDLLLGVAKDKGLELDPDELAELGLSEEDITENPEGDVLLDELGGSAAAASEIFLGESGLDASEPYVDDKTGLMWAPIMREGQWAVRPGPAGQKRRVPLKIVAGKSKNARKEIGLSDLHDAFHDEAIQHVTVPTSHANTLLENQGFIKDMKIVTGKVARKKGTNLSEPEQVAVLMGGYDITEPETKGKMERGTIANRSAGILYDYTNTESGKLYPSVVEHVALTNKPWITGMKSFFRKLKSAPKVASKPIALSLSDDSPSDDELESALALSVSDPQDYFDEAGDWSQEESPNWLRQQVDSQLRAARTAKDNLRRSTGLQIDYESRPYYRCVEAKPGSALVSDDYGDDANFWNAPIEVKDGAVIIAEFKDWAAIKKTFVPDTERAAPTSDKEPLSEEEIAAQKQRDDTAKPKLSALELAQQARKQRASQADTDNNDTPRGGGKMDPNDTQSQLSDEARRLIAEAEARAQKAEEQNTHLSERLNRVTGTVQQNEVDKFIGHLSGPIDQGGLGLSEKKGFGGVLTVVRDLMLADDGEPAIQGDAFSTDSNKDGTLSLSESLQRVFAALETAQKGGENLADQVAPSTETVEPKKDEKAKSDQLSTEGKPKTDEDEKPKPDSEKTRDELLSEIGTDDPEFLKSIGVAIPAAAATTKEA